MKNPPDATSPTFADFTEISANLHELCFNTGVHPRMINYTQLEIIDRYLYLMHSKQICK